MHVYAAPQQKAAAQIRLLATHNRPGAELLLKILSAFFYHSLVSDSQGRSTCQVRGGIVWLEFS